jgi:hypothetical protein
MINPRKTYDHFGKAVRGKLISMQSSKEMSNWQYACAFTLVVFF